MPTVADTAFVIARVRAEEGARPAADQLDRKRSLLAAAEVAPPAEIAQVPCDFTGDFESVLIASLEDRGFRAGAGALFVWEGVVAYLDDTAVDRTLAFVARAGGPGSRLVLDTAESRFDPEPLSGHARRAGFQSLEETPFDVLWRRHLGTEPHPYASVMRMAVARV